MLDVRRIAVATLLAVVVMSVSVTYVFLSPRPYGVQITDSANDYYYNGSLIVHGYPPDSIQHPGTPIQYLTAVLIRIVGGGLENTQIVLNVGRLLASFLLALSLAVSICLLPRRTPASIALLTGAVVVACPPLLSQLDYFGLDPYVVASTLLAIALLWRELLEEKEPRKAILALSGTFLGLACAIKITALPLTATTILAITIILWKPVRSRKRPLTDMMVLPASVLLSSIVFTLPMAHRYPEFIRYLSSIGGSPFHYFHSAQDVIGLAATLPVFTILGIVLLGVTITSVLRHRTLSSASFFLLLLFLPLLYSTSQINRGADLMSTVHGIRFLLPSYLVLVLCVHYIFLEFKPRSTQAHLSISACAIAVLILTIVPFTKTRSEVLQEKMEVAPVLENIVNDFGGTSAVWHKGSYRAGVVEPSALFHYWGNHRYGQKRFTEEILEHFPGVAFFNYHAAKALAGGNPAASEQEVVMGETKGVAPSIFLFPEDTVEIHHFTERSVALFGGAQEELKLYFSGISRLIVRDLIAFVPEFLRGNRDVMSFLKGEMKKSVKTYIDSHPGLPDFLRERRQGRTDLLAFLSERYGRSFSVYRITVAGHPWILLSETEPDIPQGDAALPVQVEAL